MTALAPASASILTVPSPRPEAPPVTIKVLPLSCISSPLSFFHAVLRDEISPALELLLAFHLFHELLAAFLELLVVLRLVFGLLAFRGRAGFARFACDRYFDVVIVADPVADPE